jgi:hypothetical protein
MEITIDNCVFRTKCQMALESLDRISNDRVRNFLACKRAIVYYDTDLEPGAAVQEVHYRSSAKPSSSVGVVKRWPFVYRCKYFGISQSPANWARFSVIDQRAKRINRTHHIAGIKGPRFERSSRATFMPD